jgi:hypothetical protein
VAGTGILLAARNLQNSSIRSLELAGVFHSYNDLLKLKVGEYTAAAIALFQ